MILRTSLRRFVDKLYFLQVRLYSPPPGETKYKIVSSQMRLGELETMKLENDLFRSILTPEMKIIEELFKKNGFELRIAGGAVRDLLMAITPHDIDFASTATPTQMKEMFTSEGVRMINFGGEKHGTITARINDKANFEITTLRIDKVTDGRHAEVEFTTDWQIDANRRDLTVNAMFLSFDGTVYDYFKGREHLEQRKILFVGDAASRIREDYLRILRYFRFYGRLAVDADRHDAATLEAIRLNSDGLSIISGERLYAELAKIADGGFHCSLLCLMSELGVLQHLGFPQNPNLDEFRKVCDRSRELKPQAITRLAALIRTEEEAMKVHERLKLSNVDKNLLLFLVLYRDSLKNLDDSEKLKSCQSLMYKRDIKRISVTDSSKYVQELLKYNGEGRVLQEFEEWDPPKLPVTGHDLRSRGIEKGPQLGYVLEALREIWVENDFSPGKDELLDKIPEILKRRPPKKNRDRSPKTSEKSS